MSKPLIAVFAGASKPKNKRVIKLAQQLGTAIGEQGFDAEYGCGSRNVMGAVTEAAHEAGSDIFGIGLHRFAGDKEKTPTNILGFVETEYERFPFFLNPENNDRGIVVDPPVALFVLPGGAGTLREAVQGIEHAVYNGGPPVVLAKSRYLKGIKRMFNDAIAQGFIDAKHRDVLKEWKPGQDIREVLAAPSTVGQSPLRKFIAAALKVKKRKPARQASEPVLA